MLQAASQTMSESAEKTKLVAVTMITSLDQQQLKLMGIQLSSKEYVQQLADIALQAKMDGVVCSAHEVQALRNKWGHEPIIVTPGIRMPSDNHNDQSRVAKPHQARQWGANYIVIGRPITQAKDPVSAINQYLSNWSSSSS